LQGRQGRQTTFAALLLAISVLSLTPAFVHADQLNTFPVTISATGEATGIGTGPSGSASLNITADGYVNANKWLMLQNVTGGLDIGSTSYQLTGGQGSVNQFGDLAIFANTNAGELVLHGTLSGKTISITTPSQITGLAFLSLAGTMTQQTGQSSGSTVSMITSSSAVNASVTGATNRTQNNSTARTRANSTITFTSLQSFPQNTIQTETNSTSTSYTASAALTAGNSTVTSPLAQNTTKSATYVTNTTVSSSSAASLSAGVGTGNNTQSSTLNPSANTTTTHIPQTSGNMTVYVTQYVSYTTSTTQTVANLTISYTMTTTVANTTVTVANATTTITATTGT